MQDQFENDYAWFRSTLPSFLAHRRGQHALVHDKSVADFFASSLDAIKAGLTRFGEGNFCVELVDDAVEDLGFYSHVGSALRA